jgi:hypothetical protein
MTPSGRRYLRALELWHYGLRDGPEPRPDDSRPHVAVNHRRSLPRDSTGFRRPWTQDVRLPDLTRLGPKDAFLYLPVTDSGVLLAPVGCQQGPARVKDENQQRLHYTAPDDRFATRSDRRSSREVC